MRVAITGVAGNVGQFVLGELVAHGHDVVGVDLAEPSVECQPFHQGRIEDASLLRRAFDGCDAVIHLAAVSRPGIVNDRRVFEVNVLGTLSVLEAVVETGVKRLVFASSEAVLGFAAATRPLSPSYLPIDEEYPLAPQDAYGLSKQFGEELCRSFTRRGLVSTICLRSCFVWSLEWPVSSFDAITNADRGRRTLWSYVHSKDAARAYRLACETEAIEHETLFITANDTCARQPTEELVEQEFAEVVWRRPLPEFSSLISNGRARSAIGFTPTMSWRTDAEVEPTGANQ